jgi:hypothetical protein
MMIVVQTLIAGSVILLYSPLLVTSGSVSFDADNAVPAIFNTIDWIPIESMGGGGDNNVNAEKLRPMPPVSNSWMDPFAEIFVGNYPLID